MKPIYLLSDSALLFQKNSQNEYCLHSVRSMVDKVAPAAVYIGASNGDVKDFYDIFQAGMHNLEIDDCTHVRASFSESEATALKNADIILLAGGDPQQGWEAMAAKGILDIIREKYLAGTVLMGVSAGAIQLSWELSLPAEGTTPMSMFQFAPFLVDVHDEDNDWQSLKRAIKDSQSMKRGLGICKQSGLIYHDDQTLEILGKPAYEFIYKEASMTESLLWEQTSV